MGDLDEYLCGAITAMGPNTFAKFLAGLTPNQHKKFLEWRKQHLAEDNRHRERKLKEEKIRELKASAASKLTKAELAALKGN
jgi:hypothetical protein